MKKLSIFVEGRTERVFVEQLLRQLVDEKKLHVVIFQATGGRSTPRRLTLVSRTNHGPEQIYYIQIVESGNDRRVGSDIRDNYESLVRNGFEAIIGIRDVYPEFTYADIPKLRSGLRYKLRTRPVEVVFILGVMEIESWFLAEHTHFPKIHANLTVARIRTAFSFDPSTDDMQLLSCPHGALHNIYALEGLAYHKSKRQIQRTVQVLDYGSIYLELVVKFQDLAMLAAALDAFLT